MRERVFIGILLVWTSTLFAGSGVVLKLINYPNPFNPELEQTTIEYVLGKSCSVELIIYDLSGREVLSRHYKPGQEGGKFGRNLVYWNGRNQKGQIVQNGTYICCVRVKIQELVSPLYESKRIKIGVKR